MDIGYTFPHISVNLDRLSYEQVSSLRQANEVLRIEYVCLSRIREPLGMVGGYWNMDPEIIFKVATGSLQTVISGIEQMCMVFASIYSMPELCDNTKQDIELFLDRASAWVKVNQICSY
ncbi:hypothetical protein IW140_005576 [Coemansia sp. RSA 1813]|nr:hypothetical protein EV178_005687 [Coemansia sp. RSA 1646]KAJ1765572.1 hypothetical protein LPJ74_006299 [Coemansia sp. RSA 1843]KAJ2086594.1 hypothetical protein IW138_005587 [Coemansia sp. RSA 986]KAJ2211805.1 hypothetical protein EV179_005176 [Coemansia sp. RSA 487]KAJ2564855.1 hypothetical protein IW140_005576 [Coemansia sp. RSA 1813]